MDNIITSRDNEKVKYIKSLIQKKKRDQERKYLVEGIRFVEEALAFPGLIHQLVYAPGLMNTNRGQVLIENIKNQNLPLLPVADNVFKDLSDTESPQGILAVVRMPENSLKSDSVGIKGKSLLLIIDGVQDPGNLGTIVRTADAAGVEMIILLKGTVDIYNPKTLRSTMGSVFRVPVCQTDDADTLVQSLRANNIKLFAASVGVPRTIYEADFSQPVAILMGSEAAGPRQSLLELADELVTIPMPGQAESLNVAIASGIVLFEALRQRR